MQLRINIRNIEIFNNLENILYSDDKSVGQWFNSNLPGEVYEELSPQYELQVLSAMQIKKTLGSNIFKNIKGIYWGSDQCEFLVPTLAQTQHAVELLKQFDSKYVTKDLKRLVFLTPYYAHPTMRTRLIDNFHYLNNNANHINKVSKIIEVVVNDIGTLELLSKYPNLKPIFGRLLIKTIKNPLVDTFGLENNIHIPGEMMKNKSEDEINSIKKQIATNQKKGFGRSAINNKFFQIFLQEQKINRTGLDYQINYPSLYQNYDFMNMDIYYPYALVMVGRLCDCAGIENIRKSYYPTDEICPQTCHKYDLVIQNIDTVGYKLLQRGNAQFKSQLELELPADTIEKYENRLVYTPLI